MRRNLIIGFMAVFAWLIGACGESSTGTPSAQSPVEVTRLVEVTVVRLITATAAPSNPVVTLPASVTARLAPVQPTTGLPATAALLPVPGSPLLEVHSLRNEAKIDYRSPKAGFTFLVVDFTINNAAGKELTTGSSYLKIKSAPGYVYGYTDVSFLLPRSLKAGRLAPGEKVRAELVFEVPQNEQMKVLSFEDFSNNKFSVALP